jgi:molybdate-binding protein
VLGYPVEDDSPQLDWHDGVSEAGNVAAHDAVLAERTLVIAGCDPAAGLLAAEYARQFQFRLIVLRRSSRAALELLAAGKVHAAGVHLGQAGGRGAENSRAAKASIGKSCRVVRVARWEEGLAVNPQVKVARASELSKSPVRWVGREEGSGARQCQDEILAGKPAPRHVAFDHRSVAAAIRSGWADVGPCLRLTSEEAGLKFIKMHAKDYDLCFSDDVESDPRLAALLATLRSRRYRTRLAELPGYASDRTGELV